MNKIEYNAETQKTIITNIDETLPAEILRKEKAVKNLLKIEFDRYHQEALNALLNDLLLNWDTYIKVKNTIVDDYKVKKSEYETKVK